MRNFYTFILIFIFLCSPSFGQSKSDKAKIIRMKKEAKRQLLNESQQRLQIEKEKLYQINQKEKQLSRELKKTESSLWKVEESIRSVKDRQERVTESIAITESDIVSLKKQISVSQKNVSKRLKELYKNRDINYWAVLLESESFYDCITKMDFLRRIFKTDLNMIADLRNKQTKLQKDEEYLKSLKVQLVQSEAEQRKEQISYQQLRSEHKEILDEVSAQQTETASNVYEMEHLSKELEHQLESIIREEQRLNAPQFSKPSSSVRGEGVFIWPARGVITSDYGYRIHPIRGTSIFHSGIDIGADYGVPIRASASGIVIMSEYYGGYGNAIIIDHGNGYSTLYGHCSALFVGRGQRVSQGSIIASIGSTGMSTGPHLHFEVRYNGSPIDPRSKL